MPIPLIICNSFQIRHTSPHTSSIEKNVLPERGRGSRWEVRKKSSAVGCSSLAAGGRGCLTAAERVIKEMVSAAGAHTPALLLQGFLDGIQDLKQHILQGVPKPPTFEKHWLLLWTVVSPPNPCVEA